jgi:UMF1 family MFS transporter
MSEQSPARSALLNDGVRRREVFGWAMYDFANSGYTTVVLTAVFNAYFVSVIARRADWATFAWTAALAVSSLLVIVSIPLIGALADVCAAKKRLLLVATIGCVLSTGLLALSGPGTLVLAVVLIIASNYFFSVGEALIGAFLPELAKQQSLGKVSGWGWSFGYFGGMLALGLCLAWVLYAQSLGQSATDFVPVTLLITAALFATASLPTFLLLKERSSAQGQPTASIGAQTGQAFQRVLQTWAAARRYKDFGRLLLCGALYQAGISVVIALAAIYAEQVMGFQQSQTMALVFAVNIASALGAFIFGYGQDRIGHRLALGLTLLGWIAMVLVAALGETVGSFWFAAVLAGLCMGSSQSGGRALVGLLAPAERLGEFFGLWALAMRVAAIIGPLTYGAVTWATQGNHRLAILLTGLFFVAGLVVLMTIRLDRGVTAARSSQGSDAAI